MIPTSSPFMVPACSVHLDPCWSNSAQNMGRGINMNSTLITPFTSSMNSSWNRIINVSFRISCSAHTTTQMIPRQNSGDFQSKRKRTGNQMENSISHTVRSLSIVEPMVFLRTFPTYFASQSFLKSKIRFNLQLPHAQPKTTPGLKVNYLDN